MRNKYLTWLLPIIGIIGLLVYWWKNKQVKQVSNPVNNQPMTPIRRMSVAGKNLIKKWEGKRLTAYDDGTGVWTIGYGHTKGVKKGQTITDAQADAYFDEDVRVFEDFVAQLDLSLLQNQFDALCCLIYNIGATQFLRSTLYGVLKETLTDKQRISAAWSMWNMAGGRVLQGLKNRRNDEINFYFS